MRAGERRGESPLPPSDVVERRRERLNASWNVLLGWAGFMSDEMDEMPIDVPVGVLTGDDDDSLLLVSRWCGELTCEREEGGSGEPLGRRLDDGCGCGYGTLSRHSSSSSDSTFRCIDSTGADEDSAGCNGEASGSAGASDVMGRDCEWRGGMGEGARDWASGLAVRGDDEGDGVGSGEAELEGRSGGDGDE